MKNQLKAGAVLTYISLFVNSIISILYTPIMLNLLGQSEYGLYSLAGSAAGFIGILNFGLGNAVIRYTAKYKALNDEESCSRVYGLFLIMYGILGGIALVAGIIITFNSHLIFSSSLSIPELQKLKLLMSIMTINLSLGIGLGLFSVIILANEKFIFQKIIVIVSSIISPLVMLPLLLCGYGSIMMAIVTTVINFLSIVFNMYYCFKVLKIKIKFNRLDATLLKEIIIFSFYIFINLIIGKIYDSTDQIILGVYSGTVAVSIYTIGATFTGYFSGFSSAISNVFLSKVTGMVTREVSNKELSDLFIRIGRIQYIIISFALSGFVVFGKEFIVLWVGDSYKVSFIIAIIIIVPMIVSLIQSMGGVILQARNMQRFKTIVSAVVAVVNVFLSIVFVQKWGVVGCVVATAIAFTIGNIVILNIYYWKKININIPKFWKNILYMSVPLAISVTTGMIVNKNIQADNWLILFMKMIVFSILYIILMWFISMNKDEKNLIASPLKRFILQSKQQKKINVKMN